MTRPEHCRWCGSRLQDGKCEVCGGDLPPENESETKEDTQYEQPA